MLSVTLLWLRSWLTQRVLDLTVNGSTACTRASSHPAGADGDTELLVGAVCALLDDCGCRAEHVSGLWTLSSSSRRRMYATRFFSGQFSPARESPPPRGDVLEHPLRGCNGRRQRSNDLRPQMPNAAVWCQTGTLRAPGGALETCPGRRRRHPACVRETQTELIQARRHQGVELLEHSVFTLGISLHQRAGAIDILVHAESSSMRITPLPYRRNERNGFRNYA